MNRKKTATAIGILALIAAALGFAGMAKADDKDDDGKDKPWGGPDPGKPGGPRPKKPSGTGKRPAEIEPWTLWISADCDDVMIGETWWEETAKPAIREWIESGYGAPQDTFDDDIKAAIEYGRDAVVRGILGPYSPLCIDSYPWWDVYEKNNPKPQWDPPEGKKLQAWGDRIADRQTQWANDYPALIELISELQWAVTQAWSEENE